jgi:hypothetical protein
VTRSILPLLLAPLLVLLASPPAPAAPEAPSVTAHAARFGAGAGPVEAEGTWHLLDAARTPGQSNAVAFDRQHAGAHESVTLTCRLRVDEGGDGGAFCFLATDAYGVRGPAPFVPDWTVPDLKGSFAVGIDVHDPPTSEPFGPLGNVLGKPEREVSLHWDGREIVKRVAPAEFRGEEVELGITLEHVLGGAEATVRLAGALVYERYFLPGLQPYELRLAMGAQTRAEATTLFSVRDVALAVGAPAAPRRPPLRVEVFHHVRTDNLVTAHKAEVDLPPLAWALGRVIMTIDLHDAGEAWDEWDRNGEVSIFDDEGTRRGIVPFITSYRTPCHWEVDVSHFRPLLAGRRTFEIAAGTTFYKNRGYLMSVSLDFHHGQQATEPFEVVPLWIGTAHYRSAENHFQDFFEPRVVPVAEEATAARLFVTTTGHSQVGEFTPSRRTIAVTPAGDTGVAERFQDTLWKEDCYLNPNRPQFGTWKYPRAGWAPGDVVRPWVIPLGASLVPGGTLQFVYEPEPYTFPEGEEQPTPAQVADASHVVRAWLVLYRPAAEAVPAPTVRVLGVNGDSNAARAGIQAGDWLAVYDGQAIDTVDDLRAALQAAQVVARPTITAVIYRGLERIEVQLAPGTMGVQLSGP